MDPGGHPLPAKVEDAIPAHRWAGTVALSRGCKPGQVGDGAHLRRVWVPWARARPCCPAAGRVRQGACSEGRRPIRRPAPAVAGLAAFALLLGLGGASAAGALAPGTGAAATLDQAASAQVLEAGRGLYVANCASCHGNAGQGTDNAPSLQAAGAAAADFYLRTGRMPLGAPGQQAIRQPVRFSEAEIESLVAYVASLGNGPAIPQVKAGGDVNQGWELYRANCAACHSVSGAGNAIGGGFAAPNLGQATPTEINEATLIGPGAMPRFSFSPSDESSIIAYLQYIRNAPAPGGAPIEGIGPVAEGFVGLFVVVPILVMFTFFAARALSAHVLVPAAPGHAANGSSDDLPAGPSVPDGPEGQQGEGDVTREHGERGATDPGDPP
jgi:ubiquinol-cytochrome c reductase cytochrome c subunit